MTDTNAAKKSIYIAPTPPANLIDSMSFTIDFAGRKFLQVGALLITKSCYPDHNNNPGPPHTHPHRNFTNYI